MKTLGIGLGVLFLSACNAEMEAADGGTQSPFVGTWTGNSYATAIGAPTMQFGPAPDMVISRGPGNTLVLGACPFAGGSVPATPVDAANLELAAARCPRIHSGGDCTVDTDISGGTANVRGPLLTVEVVGHVGLCDGGTQDYFGNFTGAK